MKIAIRIVIIGSLLICGCAAQHKIAASKPATAPAEPVLTAEQREKNVKSFDEVWTTIRDKHFDPKLNGADWDGARAELRPKVENAKTMSAARAAMTELLARLNETHFAIIPSSVYHATAAPKHADEKSHKTDSKKSAATDSGNVDAGNADAGDNEDSEGGEGISGIDLRIVNGHALVISVAPKSGAESVGIKPGWELVSIHGKPIAPVIAELATAVKSESLRPAMQAITLDGALHGPVGKTITTSFINGQGKTVEVKLPMRELTGNFTKFGNLPKMPLSFDCRKVDPNISVFRLSIFLDPPSVMPAFRACVEKSAAENATGFILDLRGNHGGIGIMAVGMGSLFVSKPDQYLGQMFSRAGPGLKFELDPQPVHYDGPLAILVDECSISTSEIMAGGLRDIGRARIFGVRTAGAALPSVVVKLPNDDRFQYAVANYISAGGKTLEGTGVIPDELVVPDRASLLAGKDPILDAAVKWCKSQKQNGNH